MQVEVEGHLNPFSHTMTKDPAGSRIEVMLLVLVLVAHMMNLDEPGILAKWRSSVDAMLQTTEWQGAGQVWRPPSSLFGKGEHSSIVAFVEHAIVCVSSRSQTVQAVCKAVPLLCGDMAPIVDMFVWRYKCPA